MVRTQGEVKIYVMGQEDFVLDGVLFHFNEGARAVYTGSNYTFNLFRKPGWLGLQSPALTNWSSAYMFELSFPNGSESHHVFTVEKNASVPVEDDGWFWYPVNPVRATPLPRLNSRLVVVPSIPKETGSTRIGARIYSTTAPIDFDIYDNEGECRLKTCYPTRVEANAKCERLNSELIESMLAEHSCSS